MMKLTSKRFHHRLGQELAKLGNQVTLVKSSNNKISLSQNISGFESLTFQTRHNEVLLDLKETQDIWFEFAISKDIAAFYEWYLKKMVPFLEEECYDMLQDEAFMKKLKDRKIEFLVFDFEPDRYLQVVSKLLNSPYAVLSLPHIPWRFGIPRIPSFASTLLLGHTDKMSFAQRVRSLGWDLFFNHAFFSEKEKDIWYYEAKEKFGTNVKSHGNFIEKASLFLYLEDPVVSYARPTTPRCILISDIMARPSEPLPNELETFVAQKPTVLVSFGSFIHTLPTEESDKFCNVFEKLTKFNFIWKVKNEAVCGRKIGNLMLRSWVPQNDLLSKVVLFVSHGGYNSLMEAVHHGTPLLVFPMAIDQLHQANLAESKKFGIKMDFSDWSEQELIDNILMLTSKESAYKKSANRWSSIMKDRPITAAQKVSHAIKHVIKFGDEHLVDNSTQLYWFQYFMFDIFLAFLVIIGLTAFLLLFLLKLIIKKVSLCKNSKIENKKQK